MTVLRSACLLLLSASAAVCFGQGSISGKILTAAGNGAPVPKAPVIAKNLDTQETYKAASAADGSFALNGIAPGTYEISVENVTFFLPFHQSGVQVAAEKTTRLDIRLDDFQLNTLGDGGEQFVANLGDKAAPSGPTPRASDGKPDLSGIWQSSLGSLIGEAPDPLPWAEAIAKKPPSALSGPARCLPWGFPMSGVWHTRSCRRPPLS